MISQKTTLRKHLCTIAFHKAHHHCCHPSGFRGNSSRRKWPRRRRSFANSGFARHSGTDFAPERTVPGLPPRVREPLIAEIASSADTWNIQRHLFRSGKRVRYLKRGTSLRISYGSDEYSDMRPACLMFGGKRELPAAFNPCRYPIHR
jgi:hypothetical protein